MRNLVLIALVACGSNHATPDATDLCTAACSAEILCGLTIDAATCVSNCNTSPSSYQQCLSAAAGDCNKSALCFWDTTCPAQAPTGTASCNATAVCQANCNASNPTPACECGCVAVMNPARAMNLLINDFCGNARCPQFCTAGATFNGVACNQCFAENCADKAAQCTMD